MKKLLVLTLVLMALPSMYGRNMRIKSYSGYPPADLPHGVVVVCLPTDFYYDKEGRLIKIQYPHRFTTINYRTLSDGYLFFWNVKPDEDFSAGYKAFVDENGKVTVAEKASAGFGSSTLAMQYTDGHFSSLIDTGDKLTKFTNLTYDSGKIVRIESFTDINPDDIEWREYSYSGIVNIHGLNLLEYFFEADLGGIEILAQAGFLGEPPAEFPSSVRYSDGRTVRFSFEFDQEGYPIKFYLTDTPDIGINIIWEEAPEAGLDFVEYEECAITGIYLLDGTPVSDMQNPGLYIVRRKDGSCRKILKN